MKRKLLDSINQFQLLYDVYTIFLLFAFIKMFFKIMSLIDQNEYHSLQFLRKVWPNGRELD